MTDTEYSATIDVDFTLRRFMVNAKDIDKFLNKLSDIGRIYIKNAKLDADLILRVKITADDLVQNT